ncbi:MAG: hypothetical protein JSV33_10530 [bacterium]|nr:MAG: hypothetical protein JSV33_10530 [bacterium]
MKLIHAICLMTLAVTVFTIGCSETEFATVKMVTDRWSGWSGQHQIDSVMVTLQEGEHFGPTDFIGSKGRKPFKLVEVVNRRTIDIWFCEALVVAGDPINEPTEYRRIFIYTEETCFRTRTYDAGIDIYLEVVD